MTKRLLNVIHWSVTLSVQWNVIWIQDHVSVILVSSLYCPTTQQYTLACLPATMTIIIVRNVYTHYDMYGKLIRIINFQIVVRSSRISPGDNKVSRWPKNFSNSSHVAH